MTDTLQAKGATAASNRAPKTNLEPKGTSEAYTDPATSSTESNGVSGAARPVDDVELEDAGRDDLEELEQVDPEHPDDVPPVPKTKHEEAVTFKNGDHVEIAERLVYDRRKASPFVYVDGEFYQYGGGIFRTVPRAELSRHVGSYSRCRVETSPRGLALRRNDIAGAIAMAADFVDDLDFFENGRAGVAFADCFVEATAGEIVRRPHSERHRARFAYPFDFVDAEPARLLGFFEEVFRRDVDAADKVRLIQEFTGACLLGIATKYQKSLFIVGGGGNGKGTLCEIIGAIMPPGSVCAVAPQKLGDDYRRAMLAGKLLNLVSELPRMDFAESESWKSAIAGDLMDGRAIKRDPFTFRPIAGHIYSANALPGTSDHTRGFWRRALAIGFRREFDDASARVGLAGEIIEAETPAIVSWVLRGAQRLLAAGSFTVPESSRRHVDDWRKAADPVRQWLEEADLVDLQPGERQEHGLTASDTYARFRKWCELEGMPNIMAQRTFGARMRQAGYPSRHDETGAARRYRLRDPSPTELEALRSARASKGGADAG